MVPCIEFAKNCTGNAFTVIILLRYLVCEVLYVTILRTMLFDYRWSQQQDLHPAGGTHLEDPSAGLCPANRCCSVWRHLLSPGLTSHHPVYVLCLSPHAVVEINGSVDKFLRNSLHHKSRVMSLDKWTLPKLASFNFNRQKAKLLAEDGEFFSF